MAVLLAAVTETVSITLVHATPGRFGRDEVLDEAVEALCRYVERPASTSVLKG